MIPKSGSRFSDKVMVKQKEKSPIHLDTSGWIGL